MSIRQISSYNSCNNNNKNNNNNNTNINDNNNNNNNNYYYYNNKIVKTKILILNSQQMVNKTISELFIEQIVNNRFEFLLSRETKYC